MKTLFQYSYLLFLFLNIKSFQIFEILYFYHLFMRRFQRIKVLTHQKKTHFENAQNAPKKNNQKSASEP
jgi:hypothetical protein